MCQIEIMLPNEYKEPIYVARVGKLEQGEFVLEQEYQDLSLNLHTIETAVQMEQAAQYLAQRIKEYEVYSAEENKVFISNLKEGVYLIQFENTSKMKSTLVYLPTWIEAERKFTKEVQVVPKYSHDKNVPSTGDHGILTIYLFLVLISLGMIKNCAKLLKKQLYKNKNT